ncbi:hypothetical protein M569_12208 [Genlisea aurea]|uniref:UBA domain-containing protein n=1 Tax=Genlisea aurea TaxID=192259 RepID=S8C716_9LAMI|nr:hypothetical protein M569_12208 [Genlisea aurea]
MAGFSLKCGDCGTLLKSVEEAQEHAELTKHANFVESTEAVLNLVCSSCGKPCRSKTETDLHTKRTGHIEFVDKTAEAAKPISLDAPKPKDDTELEEPSDGGSIQNEEMVVPEVNQQLLSELEEMGFPKERAIRALHFSGNVSLEAAANWIVENENDPDIDKMLLVPSSSSKTPEPKKQSLTPEEIKLKQQELKERARKKKEEDEKRMEREREKERIRVGRELLEAKRVEEENERKRTLALRKAEKEEEKRAREKIRQKLEEDKAERRRRLGLPAEESSVAKPSSVPPAKEEKASFLPVRPATKAEQMRECLRTLKQTHKDEEAKVKTAFSTLLTFAKNVATNPDEEKFRKIRLSNANFQDRVGKLKGGIEFLELCGFEKVEGGEFLFLAPHKLDLAVLHSAGSELNSAINNPFFGVL